MLHRPSGVQCGVAEADHFGGDVADAVHAEKPAVVGPVTGAGRVTFFRRLGGDPIAMAAARLTPTEPAPQAF